MNTRTCKSLRRQQLTQHANYQLAGVLAEFETTASPLHQDHDLKNKIVSSGRTLDF